MSGTSFAAPAVAGAAALIQSESVDNVLCTWPEGCRAILLASAGRNVSGSTWSIDVVGGRDGADGAGALDCDSACSTAQSHQPRGNVPAARGWDVGILSRADFDSYTSMSNWWYSVRTPFFGGTHVCTVQVALAWNSVVALKPETASTSIPTTLTLDFDLIVFKSSGRIVASSNSWDNSYEIVSFNAQPNTDYSIQIRRTSGTDITSYGLAWVAAIV
jgi:subtilisin family serine protease